MKEKHPKFLQSGMKEKAKLQKAFAMGLGLEENADFHSLEFSKTPQWDSIAHMRLIAALEEQFGIRFSVQDILGMSSYRVAKEIVQRYQKPSP